MAGGTLMLKTSKLFPIMTFVIVLGGCSQIQQMEDFGPSGSGYSDLEGTIINYDYENFSAFRFAVENNIIRWTGISGYFEDITSEVIPQVSKVADGIYFSSWQTLSGGGDNVVHNFNTMLVNAHLNPNGDSAEAMEMINGGIQCWSESDCIPPNEELTSRMRIRAIIQSNAQENNLPPMFLLELNKDPKVDADRAARSELAGMAIEYETQYGSTRIEVDGGQTRVTENQGETASYNTFATKIAENIFFVSWMGPSGGNHIIVNRETGKVFDHISPSGEREEQIYDLSCFNTVDACQSF